MRRLGALVAGLLLAGSVCVGCSSARIDVGTADESCYLALPTAAHAVGPHAHFVGVRKFAMSELKDLAPRLYHYLTMSTSPKSSVCIAAYRGHFTSSTVKKPLGRPRGPLAVPVIKSPSNQLVGTLILNSIPVRFAHTHPF